MVDEIEAEFGVVERLGIPAKRDAPLPRVAGLPIRRARHAEETAVPIAKAAGADEAPRRRRVAAGQCDVHRRDQVRQRPALRGRRVRTAQVRNEGAGVVIRQIGYRAARRAVVVGREIGARRVDAGLRPSQLPEPFDRQFGSRRGGDRRHRNRQKPLAQLGPGLAQPGYVERADHVHPPLDERALAPVQNQIADARLHRHLAEVAPGRQIQVEHFQIVPRTVARLVGERRAVPLLEVLEIDEALHPSERAERAEVHVQLADEARGVADYPAVVVQIAVVGIDTDDLVVAVADAIRHAVRERGVEAHPGPAGFEFDGRRRRDGESRQREDSRPRRRPANARGPHRRGRHR